MDAKKSNMTFLNSSAELTCQLHIQTQDITP